MITRAELAPAFSQMVEMMQSGASARDVAEFIAGHKYEIDLSHYVEDKAEEGTFAAAVFDILCDCSDSGVYAIREAA